MPNIPLSLLWKTSHFIKTPNFFYMYKKPIFAFFTRFFNIYENRKNTHFTPM